MNGELVEVRCRSCGTVTPVELDAAAAFTVACDACGAEQEGQYRPDGTVVWS